MAGRVVLESANDKGGHFAAWERPGAVARDLQDVEDKNLLICCNP